jgi:hypothetical protein
LFNVVPGGRSPEVTVADLARWGYRIAIFPALLLGPVVAACDQALTSLAQTALAGGAGPTEPARPAGQDAGSGPAELFRRVGSDEWDRLRERYATIEGAAQAVTD